jgi:FtsP/CotA-like multicopper oxidase with cupredoxin domain
VLGETLGAGPSSGSISVRVPGTREFVLLAGGAAIPSGSIVDARHGSVRIVTAVGDAGATQAATFHGAKFKVAQRSGAGGLTDIYLRGGTFAACGPGPGDSQVRAAGNRRHAVRRLWGRDRHGRFRTHGRGSIATVRGTVWVTIDRCDGTLTRVKRGAVSVRDLGRRRTVLVRGGERYLAPLK